MSINHRWRNMFFYFYSTRMPHAYSWSNFSDDDLHIAFHEISPRLSFDASAVDPAAPVKPSQPPSTKSGAAAAAIVNQTSDGLPNQSASIDADDTAGIFSLAGREKAWTKAIPWGAGRKGVGYEEMAPHWGIHISLNNTTVCGKHSIHAHMFG